MSSAPLSSQVRVHGALPNRLTLDELIRRAHDGGSYPTVGDTLFFEQSMKPRMPGNLSDYWMVDDIVMHEGGLFDFRRDDRRNDVHVRAYTLVVQDLWGQDADILAWVPRLQW